MQGRSCFYYWSCLYYSVIFFLKAVPLFEVLTLLAWIYSLGKPSLFVVVAYARYTEKDWGAGKLPGKYLKCFGSPGPVKMCAYRRDCCRLVITHFFCLCVGARGPSSSGPPHIVRLGVAALFGSGVLPLRLVPVGAAGSLRHTPPEKEGELRCVP